ncbi:hypothetical protein JOF56_004193 [Kibdelosporangium banguiense]|uniref:DUF2637 domain-containing protein n=1 Tax=Kibdelosporangium banguiense TaxID=1365924 RepID=A0ABS4THA2_9PSEU|nr:DUF2637 domain-containing protein [Kibdelosporangium banguiense]MBP2323808.1 hypothetical protein [Kibdelosporangium banguiense]
MSIPDLELTAQVRQAIEDARRAGQSAPGRPTLVRLTGATDHAVRKALAELATQTTSAGEPDAQHADDIGRWPRDQSGATDWQSAGDAPVNGAAARAGGHSDVTQPAADQATAPGDRSVAKAPAPVPPGGRLVAWVGFVFGSVMSIAANVLHAWLPAGHEPAGWSPGIAPQVGAAVWPVGLMLAVEALSRIRWPKGLGWGLARFGGAGAVAVGSAVISYGHLRDVLLAWHYGPMAAAVGPLVLDGLMVVCGFALLANSHTSAGEPGGDRRHHHRRLTALAHGQRPAAPPGPSPR